MRVLHVVVLRPLTTRPREYGKWSPSKRQGLEGGHCDDSVTPQEINLRVFLQALAPPPPPRVPFPLFLPPCLSPT